MNSQPFELAREKFGRSMHLEKQWLVSALKAELTRVREMERAASFHFENNSNELKRMQKESQIKRRQDAEKRMEADKRMMELEEARRRDRLEAKENFRKRQEEMQAKEERMREETRLKFLRQLEQEEERAKKEMEREQKALQEEEETRLRILKREQDDTARKLLREARKNEFLEAIKKSAELKEKKINDALKRDAKLRTIKMQHYKEKEMKEEEIKEQKKQQELFEAIEKAKKMQMKEMLRQRAMQEAKKREQEMIERVLIRRSESEMKLQRSREEKERQIVAKREADFLKEACRDFNLERLRRRDDFKKETIAEHTALKMARSKILEEERRLMQIERKKALEGSYRAREIARNMIHEMKIKSKFNSGKIAHLIQTLTKEKTFSPLFKSFDPSKPILQSVASADHPGCDSPLPTRGQNVGMNPLDIPAHMLNPSTEGQDATKNISNSPAKLPGSSPSRSKITAHDSFFNRMGHSASNPTLRVVR
eukprot:GDKJ01019389.1.p1 GENE.GDKJ01019389.1~~GDKJ01019389.1.p1  ORF type:complete len:484 (+),score=145.53 GDKJ01019389.1:1-1452(+)